MTDRSVNKCHMDALENRSVTEITIDLTQLSNVSVRQENDEFIASLMDDEGMELLRGFGHSPIEALNDLHGNLI